MIAQLIRFSFITFLCFAGFSMAGQSQTLIMNEVSNGTSGNQEYVEFVVYDTNVVYGCSNPNPPCIDIRGWIFDDNSGYHGPGGIAAGCVRFSFDPIWSCVPVGTIITIYNNLDPNGFMPPNDLSMADGNCRITAPINDPVLFESNPTTPGAVACSYPATGWVAGGNWSFTLLANPGDCARIVDLAGCEVFSVCWGTDNLNTLIYFASGGTGVDNVWSFTNDIDNSPFNQANWTEGCTDLAACGSNSQTPGQPNNAANASWIGSMNNNCSPISPLVVDSTISPSDCSCTGVATANASGSIPGYTYTWFPAPGGGQGTATATGLCPGNYTCVVTSFINCTDSMVVNIPATVVIPVITITNPQPIICTGETVTLAGNGGVSYVWSTGAITPSITVSPLIPTTYTVTATAANGCTGTATTTISINTNLVFTANANSPLCIGSQLDLSAQNIGGATYNWIGPNGFNVLNQQNPSIPNITIPASGTYTVTATNASGCTGSSTVNVLVHSLPVPIANNNGPVCEGNSLNLMSNGGIDFDWTGPGGYNQPNTQNTSIPNVTLANAGTYTVTVTDGNGCSSTSITDVTVQPAPIASAINSGAVCEGESVNLSGGGGSTYSWIGPNGFNDPINQNPILANVTISQNGIYTVTVTDLAGCTSSATTTVIISAAPNLNANTNAPLCSGNDVQLNATGAVTYNWVGPMGFSDLTQNPIINNSTPANNGSYTVTGTNAAGCTNSTTVQITVFQSPVALFTGDNLSGCAPVCANLNDLSSVLGSTITNWNWNVEGQNISSNPNEIFCFPNPGSYDASLTVTTIDGCANTLSFANYINVTPTPVAGFAYSPNIIFEADPTVNFVNHSTGATSYGWDFGDGSSSILENPIYTYSDTGTYCIVLIATNNLGCTDTAEHCLDIIPEFTIYIPNSFTPNADEMNPIFKVYGQGIAGLEARIFNRWGEEIFSFFDLQSGWDGDRANGSICPMGVYVYKITATDFIGKEYNFIGQVNLLR